MTAWGMAIPCIIQRICEKSTFPVSSSEAEPRDLFRWRQEGARLTARNGKHRITERRTVLPVNGLAKKSWKKGTKKISRCARNDSVGDGYPVHHTKNVWEKHVSRIVIGSEVEGSFSLAVRRRASDGEKRETPYHGKWKWRVFRIVIPSRVEGSFSLAVRRSVFEKEKWETPYRGKVGRCFP